MHPEQNQNIEGKNEQPLPSGTEGFVTQKSPVKNVTDSVAHEVQKHLFAMWFEGIKGGPKLRQYRVPFKLQWMPCGCERDRTNETDPNNTWSITRKGEKYSHKECRRELP